MEAPYKLKLRLLLVIILGLISLSAQSQTCTGVPAVIKTFGSGTSTYSTLTPANYGFSTTYKQENGNNSGIPNAGTQTNDGEFSFVNKTIDFWGVWHANELDHTPGDVGGYMMMVNADPGPKEFYKDTVSGLCGGITYDFSAWIANLDKVIKNPLRIMPNIKFEIIDYATGVVLGSSTSGDIPVNTTQLTWVNHNLNFVATSTKVILRLVNNNPGGSGNDLVLDDISFTPCLPLYTTSHPTVFCEGDNVKIPAFTTASNPYANPVYQWQIKNGTNWVDLAGENTDTLRFNNITISKKGWYRVLVASAGNINSPFCRSMDSLYLDVVNLPTSVLLGGEDICKGKSANLKITFTVNAPWDIVYTDGTNTMSINGINTNPYIFSVSPTVTSTYSVSAVISNSCKAVSLTGSAVVNVNPLPTAILSGNNTICNGATSPLQVNFTGTSPWSITYTDGSTPVTLSGITTNPYVFNVSPTSTKTYSLTKVQDVNCIGTTSGTALVNVNSLPTSTLTGTTAICTGSSTNLTFTFTGAKPWTFTYTDGTTPVTISGINSSPYVLSVSPTSTKTYAVTALNDLNCSASTFSNNATITVNGIPAAPTVTSPTYYKVIDVPSQLTATGTNLKWYSTPTSTPALASAPTPSNSTPGSTYYYVSQTVNGCESPRAEVEVKVVNLTTPGVIGSNQIVCDGVVPQGLVEITPSSGASGGGMSYQWEMSTDSIVWSDISGATSKDYTPTSPITTNVWYRRIEKDVQNGLYLVNTGFETPGTPKVNANSYKLVNASTVTGWNTSATDNMIELWGIGYNGVTAPQGTQFVELNANQVSRLYQFVYLKKGTLIEWNFKHRGRAGTDVAQLNIYSQNGAAKLMILDTATTNTAAWVNYSGEWRVTLPDGIYQFSFEAISTAGGNKTVGNFLDDVNIVSSQYSNIVKLTPQKTPAPVVADIVYCQNASTVALTATGISLKWYTTPTLGVSSSSVIPSSVSPGLTSYFVSQTIKGCEGPRAELKVTVHPTPTVAKPTDQVICNGANSTAVTFTGTVATTVFDWTNTNSSIGLAATGTGNINSFATINAGTTAQTATVTVTPKANNCVGSTQTFTYTINPTPTVAKPANQVNCNGTNSTVVTFTGTVATTVFDWTNTNSTIGLAATGTGNINSFATTNSGSTTQTASVTITPKANNCVGTAQTFTYTVHPTPTVAKPTDQVICKGASSTAVNFTGTVASTVFDWANTNSSIGFAATGIGNINSFATINAGTTAQTATVTVTPKANNCVGSPQTFTYTINPTPTVAKPANQVNCNGTNSTVVTFTGTVATTVFDWTNSNSTIGLAATGTGNINSFATTNTGTTTQVGTVTITPKANNCVGAAQTFTYTVHPTPTVAKPTDQVICNGASSTAVTFSGTVASTVFDWVNTNSTIGLAATGTGNINSFATTNTGTTAQTATVTVTPKANNCVGSSQTFTYTINPTPTVAKPANQVNCNGTNSTVVTFTGTVATTVFDWTNSNSSIGLAATGTGNINSFATTNTGTTTQVGTVTITPKANNCVGTAQTFTYTVHPTPTVAKPTDQVICNGASSTAVNFTGTDASTVFDWANTNSSIGFAATGIGNINSFATINTGTTAQTATVTVTPKANNCVGSSQTFTYTINPTPTVAKPANQVNCNGTNSTAVNFTGTVATTVFDWTNSNSSIGLAATGTGNINSFATTNTGTTTQTASVTITPKANNCVGTAQTFTYTVHPTPTVAKPTDQVICNGASSTAVTFSGTVASTVFDWANTNSSIGLAATGTGNINSFATINAGTTVQTATVTVTPKANNCVGSSQTFTYTINPTPTVAKPANQVNCNGTNSTAVNFIGTVATTVFDWTNTNSSIGLAATGTGNINLFATTNTGTTTQVGTVTITPKANNCVGTAQTFTYTVHPTPTAAKPTDQVICNGASSTAVTFSGTVASTVFDWANTNSSIGLAATGTGNINSFATINAGTTAQTATVTVTPKANNCVGSSQTFTYTINPTPTVAKPTNQVNCNGTNSTAVNFTGTVATTVFDWTNSNSSIGLAATGTGNINSFATTNTGTTTQTASVTITPKANNCVGTAQTFTYTVHPTPTVNNIGDQTICNGLTSNQVVIFGNVSGTTFTWSNDNTNVGLGASGASQIPSFVVVNNGTTTLVSTITITPTANSCVGVPNSYKYIINPTPTVVKPADQFICNTASSSDVIFSGSVLNTSFNWVNNNTSIGLKNTGTGTINSFLGVNSTSAQTVGKITITPSANGCTGTPVMFNYFINPTPSVDKVPNQQLCANANTNAITFTGTVLNSVFDWSNDNNTVGLATSGTGNIASFASQNTSNLIQTATITITPKANTCVGSTKTFTIKVNPIPVVNQPVNQILCNGAEATLINFTGINVSGETFEWKNNNPSIGLTTTGVGDINKFIVINNGNVSQTALVTVTPKANGCVGTTKSFNFIIHPTPTVNQPNDQVVCNGVTTQPVVFAGNVSNTQFDWVNKSTNFSSNGNISNFVATNTSDTTFTNKYIVTPSANNCKGDSVSFTIKINPTPNVNPLPDMQLCHGDITDSIVFSGSVKNTKFAWSHTNYGVGLYQSDTGIVPSFEAHNATPITEISNMTVTPVANSCVGSSIKFKISVNNVPKVKIVGSQQGNYCTGTTLNITGTGANTYQWIIPTGDTISDTKYDIVHLSVKDKGKYYLIGMDANNCKSIDSITFTLKNTPIIVDVTDLTVCEKSKININPSAPFNTYWKLPNGNKYPMKELLILQAQYADSGVYKIISTDNGCIDSSIVNITVQNCPPVAIADVYNIFADEKVIADSLHHPVNNDTDPNDKLLIKDFKLLNDVNSGKLVVYSDGSWTYTPEDKYEGTQILEYEICDEGKPSMCTKSTITIIVKYRGAFFPNAFTPNGDGVNDTYVIFQLPESVSAEIYVYNRWGDLVHKESNYKNDWEGKCTTGDCLGKELPTGTYYLVAELSNGTKYSSYFTLSR